MFPFIGGVQPSSFVSSSSFITGAAPSDTLTTSVPSNISNGDVIILFAGSGSSLPRNVTWPANFIPLDNRPREGEVDPEAAVYPAAQSACAYKIANGESGNYSVTIASIGGTNSFLVALCFSTRSASPVLQTLFCNNQVLQASGATHNLGYVKQALFGGVILFCRAAGSSSSVWTFSTPSGFTSVFSNSATSFTNHINIFFKSSTNSLNTGQFTTTATGSAGTACLNSHSISLAR
jgi:hypothetical protein